MTDKKKNAQDSMSEQLAGAISDYLPALQGVESLLAGAPGFEGKSGLTSHLPVLFRTDDEMGDILRELQKKHPYGAMLINGSGRIVIITEPMSRLLDLEYDADISEGYLDVEVVNSIHKSMRELNSSDDRFTKIIPLAQEGRQRLSVIEPYDGNLGRLVLIRLLGKPWHDGINAQLRETFSLTATEVELVHLLYQGLKALDIAGERDRSVATVRTQIKNILRKTGCAAQNELLSIIASLMVEVPEPQTSTTQGAETVCLNGQTLHYYSYGAREGRPVLMLHASTTPFPGECVAELYAHAGYRVIAPVLINLTSTDDFTQHISMVIKAVRALLVSLGIESIYVGGHREGVIYAAHFAALHPEISMGVLAIDMSIPAGGLPLELSPAARSLIKIASDFPFGMEMVLRLMRRLLKQGEAGGRYMVDHMARNHAAEMRDLKDPEIHDIVLRNYHYAFENCALTAELIRLWYSDWSAVAEKVARQMPLHFIQGDMNIVLPPGEVVAYCELHENLSYDIVAEAGQSLLYTHTTEVIAAMNALSQHS